MLKCEVDIFYHKFEFNNVNDAVEFARIAIAHSVDSDTVANIRLTKGKDDEF